MDDQIYSEDYSTNPVEDMEVDTNFHSRTGQKIWPVQYKTLYSYN